MAGAGLDVAIPAPPRRVRDRRPRRRERAHPTIRRPLDPPRRRARPGDRRSGPSAHGHVLLAAAQHRPAHRAPGPGIRGAVRARARCTRACEPAPVGQPQHPARQRRRAARPRGAGAPVVGAGPRQRGGRARAPCARSDGHQRPGLAWRARSTKPAGAGACRAADRGADSAPHPGSGRRACRLPSHLDRSRPDPPPGRAPPRTRRRDERARRRRAPARPGPPGPRHRGGHAVRAGMAARARLPAPRLGREPVHPARRDPLRHQRAAHPGRSPARPRAGGRRAAPAARRRCAPTGRRPGAFRGATPGAESHSGPFLERVASGLRLDQAAAAFAVLHLRPPWRGDGRPAGSGKTRTVAEMARIWRRRAWAR